MKILESWEDKELRAYALVRHSEREQGEFWCRPFEVMFEFEGELHNFGGSPGMGIADFDSLEEAQDFILTGIDRQDDNPDVWLEMVELGPDGARKFQWK